MNKKRIGADAVAAKGWLKAHRWLILRRLTQFAILGLFLLGPLTAWIANDGKEQVIKDKVFWLVKG
ncbi:MAG: hypothetical protein LBV49_03850, partial [Azonexus sp.]|nr:hypothetical protein [Azonexus sp.]